MDITIFTSLAEQDILTIRDNAISQLTSTVATPGQVVQSVSTRDLSTTFQVDSTPQDIIQACTYALQRKNPSVYGTSLIRSKRKWVS